MRQKLVIDASVFISTFSEGEKFHNESRAFLEKIAQGNTLMIVPILTIFEILQVFYRNTHDPELVEEVHKQLIDLNMAKALQIISLEASFLAHFAAHHHQFPLKTSDAVVVLTAHRENCPLISWDKQMLRTTAKEIDVFTPAEWLKRK